MITSFTVFQGKGKFYGTQLQFGLIQVIAFKWSAPREDVSVWTESSEMFPGEMRRRSVELNGFNWNPATIFEMLLLAVADDNYLEGSSVVGGGRRCWW